MTFLRVHLVTAADLASDAAVPEAASELRLYELPAGLEDAVSHVKVLHQRAAGRRVAAYSMADLTERAHGGWGSLDDVLARLVAAGLTDVAEMPVDRVSDLGAAMSALARAGAKPQRLTVSHPVGDRKLDLLAAVRRWRDSTAGPLYVSPLPRHAPIDKPTTGYEDLRMVALARLAIADQAAGPTAIAVDWSLYGPKLAQVALTFGADHLDAVPATSDPMLGRRRETVEDVERNIRAAGFDPLELRLTA